MLTPSSGGKYGCMMEHKTDKNKHKNKPATLKRLVKSVYNMKIQSKLFTCKEEYNNFLNLLVEIIKQLFSFM